MKRRIAGTGIVGVTLGALGCGEPTSPAEVRPQELFAGKVRSDDSLGGEEWRKFLQAGALHAAWVPPDSSPWRPYYKPTLVAAVSVVRPAAAPAQFPDRETAAAAAASFLRTGAVPGAAVFLDLPGPEAVTWAVTLQGWGFQPVLTFNNWPHQQGLLRLEDTLGTLLYHAAEAGHAKASLPPQAPPVFVLEGRRLQHKNLEPPAGVFDNRFFHSPSDFPGPETFRSAGITTVYYVCKRGNAQGSEEDDLNEYFVALAKAGIRFIYVKTTGVESEWATVQPATRRTIFTAEDTTAAAARRPYGRTYGHRGFWSRSRGGWGGGVGGSSGSRGFSS